MPSILEPASGTRTTRRCARSVARLMRLLWIGTAWLVVAMLWSAEGPAQDFEAGHTNRAPTSWAQLQGRGAVECDHILAEGLDVDAAAIAEPKEPIEWAMATIADPSDSSTARGSSERHCGTPLVVAGRALLAEPRAPPGPAQALV